MSARTLRRARLQRGAKPRHAAPQSPRVDLDRKSLLLGTALASTLLICTQFASDEAQALFVCPTGTGPAPLSYANVNDDIRCINTEPRTNLAGDAIYLETINPGHYIYLNNSGVVTAQDANDARGIFTVTNGQNSPIEILNSGDVEATAGFNAFAVDARADGGGNSIVIENHGGIETTAGTFNAFGINARAADGGNSIVIENRGGIETAANTYNARSIHAQAFDGGNAIVIDNHGGIEANAVTYNAFGVYARAEGNNNSIVIENHAGIDAATGANYAQGIFALTTIGGYNSIVIENHGVIESTAGTTHAFGINARAYVGDNSTISIENHGGIEATANDGFAAGIDADTTGGYNVIDIENSGRIEATTGLGEAHGINARTYSGYSSIFILNAGNIAAFSARGDATGISTTTYDISSYTKITNVGRIAVSGADYAYGIRAHSERDYSDIVVINAGDIHSTGPNNYGIRVLTTGYYGDIVVQNYGRIEGRGTGIAVAIQSTYGDALVQNYGTIVGGDIGILVSSPYEGGVLNRGSITADSLFAIEIVPGLGYSYTSIINYGDITGFIEVFGSNNEFVFSNQPGGLFEARLTSLFGGGGFFNFEGATVHTAGDPSLSETTVFTGLQLFENRGLVSLQDGAPGDIFQLIGSGPYGAYGLSFNASGDSTLAVDADLGGPGSESDIFIIEGDVTGRTQLQVNNTNPGPGVNGAVIPVIEVGGNVKSDAFFLTQPIDTGFFNYDLFFNPTGSGVFELRSFVGGGALLLPQLITGAQDIWHQGSSTWFDRTADLRVLLAGGTTPIAYNPNGGYAEGAAQGAAMTPAVWARGAGAWLDRDATETVTAFGNTYRFDLGRDLDVIDWQMGLDLGTHDLIGPGDILVFGLLGGFVGASLDYDNIARHFDFSGGQVGGYATYLNGGLFVDTLLNAHLLEMETRQLGFANSLDANTLGLRTDAGYRFGSFNGGAFIEPLATIAILWSDIDGFTNGGNTVAFDDEANVRGRLGLRVGTSYPVWGTTTVEPFVIGSVWGNLSGDNQATLTSTGTTFRFEDDLDDVWGEVSAGVNFFNPSANTAVFAKLDVTFGDDVDGIGGKAGMRVAW